ncbi:hypothetical protein [Nitrosomonas communis]|uniref:Lipoprotein n=1 Tax=Nitrosomonas communis TaxID=44574 RepID=A0A1I4NEW2_9PROT|nr:hypothetical protein [Nitrosomonas communis]SFM14074.1 hypothetical protein SAMN05421863_101482 [Nitrosomonas communis]
MLRIVRGFTLVIIGLAVTSCSDSFEKAEQSGLEAKNTYSCACTCKAHKGGGFSSYDYTEVVTHDNGITVIAKDQQQAEEYCPNQCASIRQDEINKSIKWTTDNVKVGPCEVTNVFKKYDGVGKKEGTLQSIRPRTASFEGPVDSGQSFVEIRTEDADYVKVSVKGYVSLSGGNCLGKSCDATINSVDLAATEASLLSSKGKRIKNFRAINEGLWQGSKDALDTFKFGQGSVISISGDVEGKHAILSTDPGSFVNGKLIFAKSRLTPGGVVPTNALLIDGDFVDGNVNVKIHLHLWLTNCQPEITPMAQCWGGIDGTEHLLWLSHKAKKLGYLKGGDLCAVVKTPNPVCNAGGDVEFPSFSCGPEPSPLPSDPADISKYLKFSWRDANGRIISSDPYLFLPYMPQFPLSVVVENEWGRTATGIIAQAPTGKECPSVVLELTPQSFHWDQTAPLTPEMFYNRLRPITSKP